MAAGHGPDVTPRYPVGYLKNTVTERFHPIPFRRAPMPGGADANAEVKRYRSIGHHTEGFDSIESAQKWVSGYDSVIDVGMIWEWNGNDVPAMIEFFSTAQLRG